MTAQACRENAMGSSATPTSQHAMARTPILVSCRFLRKRRAADFAKQSATLLIGIGKGDVVGMDVGHEDAIGFELPQDDLDLRPVVAELLLFIDCANRPELLPRTRAICPEKRPRNRGCKAWGRSSSQSARVGVEAEQFGHIAAANFADPKCLQAQINIAFAAVVLFMFMDLDRPLARSDLGDLP